MTNILNEIKESIIVVDKRLHIKFVNNSITLALGYELEYIYDSELQKYFKYSAEFEVLKKYIINKENKSIKAVLEDKNGDVVKYNFKVSEGKWKEEAVFFIIGDKIEEEPYTKEDLESFFREAPFICAIKDINNRYVFANKLCLQALNLKEEDIGKTHDEIFGEENTPNDMLEDSEVIKEGKIKSYYKRINVVSGITKWLEAYKIPIFDKGGKLRGIAKIGKDITLRKKVSEELMESYKKLHSINASVKYKAYNDEIFLGSLEDDFLDIMCAEGIGLWIYDRIKGSICNKCNIGISREVDESYLNEYLINEEKFVNIMKNERYEYFNVFEDGVNEKLRANLLKRGISYQYIFKLEINGEYLGFISALYKEKRCINKVDKDELKKLCEQLAIIIKNEILTKDLKSQFKKRQALEEELETLLNIGMDIFAITDEEGKVIKINKEALKLFKSTEKEMVGSYVGETIYQGDLDKVRYIKERCVKNPDKVHSMESKYYDKDGNLIWLDWRIKFIKEKRLFMGTARNITELKLLEETRSEYQKALHLESIKNEFFANISHEFKTPLNIILATMQLVNKAIDNNEIKLMGNLDFNRYRKSIVQNSYRLLRLVNNLIDMTRIDTGFYKLNLENYNIVNIVEDITTSVVQYISSKGITLIFDTDIEEEILACDPDKIERIMLNLLSNAIKYTADTGKIEVTIKENNEFVLVSVKDNGIGIPEAKLETIFDRFIQVDNILTRTCEGSGIGLSLVKSLVELHGGEIFVTSRSGEGTEFVFTLPKITVNSELKTIECNLNSKIEKCNIEFSDIYSL